jgi:hypothetical protein
MKFLYKCPYGLVWKQRKEFEFEFQTKLNSYFIQALQLHGEVLLKHYSCYRDTRGVIALPLIEISTQDLEGETVLTGTMNSRTFPHYGNTKSRWRERRKSTISQITSYSVWLLQWMLKNLMVLCLVARSF